MYEELRIDVKRYENIPVEHFDYYVEISRKQESSREELNKKVDEIRRQFFEANKEFSGVDITRVIEPVVDRLAENRALVELTLDYDGAKSKYFFPWLVEVWKSQSSALEMAFNAGFDCAGNWVEDIPEDDSFHYFIFNDPTFVFNRERELFMAKLALKKQKEAAENGKVSKVLDLGAGRMAWARRTGFSFDKNHQTIRAYDSDPTIEPEKLFDKPLECLGIDYQLKDIMAAPVDPANYRVDLVFLAGVMAYLPKQNRLGIVKIIYELLDDDGEFFFDLQINCAYLRRSVAVFGWPELRLPESLGAAVDEIESIRKELKNEDKLFSAEYTPDTFNDEPSAVMVRFKKLKDKNI